MNVDEIAREIVAREGGFVMGPADPGGAQRFLALLSVTGVMPRKDAIYPCEKRFS